MVSTQSLAVSVSHCESQPLVGSEGATSALQLAICIHSLLVLELDPPFVQDLPEAIAPVYTTETDGTICY